MVSSSWRLGTSAQHSRRHARCSTSPPQVPAKKTPTFHLPRGDYSVAELSVQAENATRHPILLQPDLKSLAKTRLRLQSDLTLPPDGWQDVLGALSATLGVVLARDADGSGCEAWPTPPTMTEWIAALGMLGDGG